MKTTSSEHVVYINCSECKNKNQFVYTTCSELVVFMYRTGKSMNNLLPYCGLVDPRMSASDKDLPVSPITVYWFRLALLIFRSFKFMNSLNLVHCNKICGPP